ncbi:RICIN domain-containing protein [Streptomyces sp. MS06]|uniref:RICIN domain-containing protein n=1 Tax=Streptomyces sp. MS06 TaxID=3385974 RepID=UPI0039A1202E
MWSAPARQAGRGRLCVDVDGASTADRARIQQWTCTGRPDRQWALRAAAGGRWTLVNLNSGKSADIADGSTAQGAHVVQLGPDGTATEQWTLRPA